MRIFLSVFGSALLLIAGFAFANVTELLSSADEARWNLDYEAAARIYESVLDTDPENIEALLGLAYSYRELERYDEAVALCDRLIALYPDDSYYWEEKGGILEEFGDYEGALACYVRAEELTPLDPPTISSGITRMLESTGDYAGLLSYYDSLLAVNESYVQAWLGKANAFAQLGDYAAALQCYDRAADIEPENVWVWFRKGDTLKEIGKHEEAAATYDHILTLGIPTTDEWIYVIRYFTIRQDSERVIRAADKALDMDPSSTYVWRMKADAYLTLGDQDAYTDCIDKVLAFEPEDEWALGAKAMDLYQRGFREESLSYYQRIVKLRPDDAGTWATTAFSLSLIGEHDLCWEYFDRALELEPEDMMTWITKAAALSGAGKFEEAITCYDRVLELDPDYYVAAVGKGDVLYELGRGEEALDVYDRAIETTPYAADAILLHKAGVLNMMGRFTEADAIYQAFLIDDPTNTVVLSLRAYNFARAGEYAEALESVREIRAIEDHVAWALFEYALSAHVGSPYEDILDKAPEVGENTWYGALLQFLNGEITGEELLAESADNGDKLCQAEYFIALKAALAGDEETARAHWDACIATGATDSNYYVLAKSALANR
jgi:tetratricopeptide (TPR) repeat protein